VPLTTPYTCPNLDCGKNGAKLIEEDLEKGIHNLECIVCGSKWQSDLKGKFIPGSKEASGISG
jgi:hypothetical protein